MANSTYGQVGGVGYSQTSFGLMNARAYCTIQLTVDGAGTITNWQYSGNPIGCSTYVRELRR